MKYEEQIKSYGDQSIEDLIDNKKRSIDNKKRSIDELTEQREALIFEKQRRKREKEEQKKNENDLSKELQKALFTLDLTLDTFRRESEQRISRLDEHSAQLRKIIERLG